MSSKGHGLKPEYDRFIDYDLRHGDLEVTIVDEPAFFYLIVRVELVAHWTTDPTL
jgi:hypothetical protein